MLGQKRIRDYGIEIGELPTGRKNAITDVGGIRVGHCTVREGNVCTGVTALIPHDGNIFREKLVAAVHVINGFGKSAGLIQIDELGTLETPILLTNTFGVGTCVNRLIQYMLSGNEDIGDKTGTVNPVVFECNDSYLNDIRGMHIKAEHIDCAIQSAAANFLEGDVGAGTGMSCYKIKGGIGTASRLIEVDRKTYTAGMLVLTNMGRLRDLTVGGRKIGAEIAAKRAGGDQSTDKGSIIMIIATDLPMTQRQLKRTAKRAEVGIARTGNNIASGSGEIVLAFSTAQKVLHYEKRGVIAAQMLNEDHIDMVFQAVAECAEEAVLNSMITAEQTTGINGHVRESLSAYIGLPKRFVPNDPFSYFRNGSARQGILIAGGVGPLAGVALHQKIVENTRTSGSDQDHIDVIHLSLPRLIHDRTAYLTVGGNINPGEQMAGLVIEASRTFEDLGRVAVVGVPCNTFHADGIFNRFRDVIAASGRSVTIVHMIDETLLWIRENLPAIRKIGLLSTTGTRKTGLYLKALKKEGYELVEVDENEQDRVHEIIYNREWGIKATTPVSKRALELSEKYARMLVEKGAQAVILGCTEFPLALQCDVICGVPLIDPVVVLARALIREVAEEKLLQA